MEGSANTRDAGGPETEVHTHAQFTLPLVGNRNSKSESIVPQDLTSAANQQHHRSSFQRSRRNRNRASRRGHMDESVQRKVPSGIHKRGGSHPTEQDESDQHIPASPASENAPAYRNNIPHGPNGRGRARNSDGQARPKQPASASQSDPRSFDRQTKQGGSNRARQIQTSRSARPLEVLPKTSTFTNLPKADPIYNQLDTYDSASFYVQATPSQYHMSGGPSSSRYDNALAFLQAQNAATPQISQTSVHMFSQPHASSATPLPVQAPTFPTAMAVNTPIPRIGADRLYVESLKELCLPTEILKKKGYIINALTRNELDAKKRCSNCGKQVKFKFGERPQKPDDTKVVPKPEQSKGGQVSDSNSTPTAGYKQSEGLKEPSDASTSSKTELKPILLCKFHPGTLSNKVWSCCRKHISSEPCSGNERHQPREYRPGELEAQWQYYYTPMPDSDVQTRIAVAIDCEMGTAKSGDSELIRLTLVDFFSAEALIDKLVYPSVQMLHYNTKWSGVTRTAMEVAKSKGNCIFGRDKAREAIWNFVGPFTMVIGHSANNDLISLRWIHLKVMDTQLTVAIPYEEEQARKRAEEKKKKEEEEKKKAEEEAKTGKTEPEPKAAKDQEAKSGKKDGEGSKNDAAKKPKGSGMFSLKTQAREKLGWDIQKGNKGHDSLEDALAARGLANWHVRKLWEEKEPAVQ